MFLKCLQFLLAYKFRIHILTGQQFPQPLRPSKHCSLNCDIIIGIYKYGGITNQQLRAILMVPYFVWRKSLGGLDIVSSSSIFARSSSVTSSYYGLRFDVEGSGRGPLVFASTLGTINCYLPSSGSGTVEEGRTLSGITRLRKSEISFRPRLPYDIGLVNLMTHL